MKMIVVLILVLFVLFCWGCIKCSSQNAWKRYPSLNELRQRLKREKIEGISFCDEDSTTDVESWYVLDEIPKDKLDGCIQLIYEQADYGQNVLLEKYRMRKTCQEMLKIVTDKGKYVAPVYEHITQDNWKERVSLIGLWPRLRKEKIENISFCNDDPTTDIDLWRCWDVPHGNLDECIKIIDNVVRNAYTNNFDVMAVQDGRMKIITNKGKYLVRAEVEINNTINPRVYGNEWISLELGAYLKNCGFIAPAPNKIP